MESQSFELGAALCACLAGAAGCLLGAMLGYHYGWTDCRKFIGSQLRNGHTVLDGVRYETHRIEFPEREPSLDADFPLKSEVTDVHRP